jgi:membrane protein implicated in regulation of membrane protease activity
VDTAEWIGLGVAAWLALSVVVALSIGKMIQKRDQQQRQLETREHQRRGPRAGDALGPTEW